MIINPALLNETEGSDKQIEFILDSYRDALEKSQFEEIIDDLIDAYLSFGIGIINAVEETMETCESIADTDTELALKLMIKLYPKASKLYLYDVCDSIDLWIYNEATDSTVSFIISSISNYIETGKLKQWLASVQAAKNKGSIPPL